MEHTGVREMYCNVWQCTNVDDAIKQAAERMSLYPLKPKQLEAIRVFISGKDTFVALPLGMANLPFMQFFHLHSIVC